MASLYDLPDIARRWTREINLGFCVVFVIRIGSLRYSRIRRVAEKHVTRGWLFPNRIGIGMKNQHLTTIFTNSPCNTTFRVCYKYMDKFVTSKVQTYQKNHGKGCMHHRYEPYPTKGGNDKTSLNDRAPTTLTRRTLTRHLLNTLCDESNPITHSDIGLRSGQSSGSA
jgi:hypothetical protein